MNHRSSIWAGLSIALLLAGAAFAHTEDDPYVTDLIAGGGNEASAIEVGEVQVWNDESTLYVKYVVTDLQWCLTETHLQVATDLDLIPQKNGNPTPGKFDLKGEHDCELEVTYEIDLDGWTIDTALYVAAHAVVCTDPPDIDDFANYLPAAATISVAHPGTGFGDPSYFDLTVSGGTSLDGTYDSYCIDTDHTISPGATYLADVYSSYATLPAGLIEFPENLDLVNWIINQGFEGQDVAVAFPGTTCTGTITYGDVQRAIWTLVEDGQSTAGIGPWSQCRVTEIVTAAQTGGEGFVPGCDELVAVILAPTVGDQIIQTIFGQVTFADVGAVCIPFECETAWGAPLDFPGRNWATYFVYTVQGYIAEPWPDGGVTTVAFEDLPLGGGNDWDYNDWVADINVLATYFGTSSDNDLVQMDFTITPQAHLAGYTHVMHLDADTIACDGTYELYRDSVLVGSGNYISSTGIDVVLVPNTGSAPGNVTLNLYFDAPCAFDFSAFDPYATYHGEDLFFDPYIRVNNTGQEIHQGDPRMLTVPIDWQWPTPDGTPVWNVYPKVTAGSPPTFVPYWWTP